MKAFIVFNVKRKNGLLIFGIKKSCVKYIIVNPSSSKRSQKYKKVNVITIATTYLVCFM